MKKIFILFIATLFIGCAPTGVQVSVDDDKSNAIRAHFQNYLNNDMDGLKTLWSPDLQVFANSTEPISLDDLVATLQAQHATFEPITMTWGNGEVDLGQWVETTNYPAGPANDAASVTTAWFNWLGTSKMSGETITIPVHVVYVWNDEGKIQTEYEYYDPTKLVAEMEAAQSAEME